MIVIQRRKLTLFCIGLIGFLHLISSAARATSSNITECNDALRSRYGKLISAVLERNLISPEQARQLAAKNEPENPLANVALPGDDQIYSQAFDYLIAQQETRNAWQFIRASLPALADRQQTQQAQREEATRDTSHILLPQWMWSHLTYDPPRRTLNHAPALMWLRKTEPTLLAHVTNNEGTVFWLAEPLRNRIVAGEAGPNSVFTQDLDDQLWIATYNVEAKEIEVKKFNEITGTFNPAETTIAYGWERAGDHSLALAQLPDGRRILAVQFVGYLRVYNVTDPGKGKLMLERYYPAIYSYAAFVDNPKIVLAGADVYVSVSPWEHTELPFFRLHGDSFVDSFAIPIPTFKSSPPLEETYSIMTSSNYKPPVFLPLKNGTLLAAVQTAPRQYEMFAINGDHAQSVWSSKQINFKGLWPYSTWFETTDGQVMIALMEEGGSNTQDIYVITPFEKNTILSHFALHQRPSTKPHLFSLLDGSVVLGIPFAEGSAGIFSTATQDRLVDLPPESASKGTPAILHMPDGQAYWASIDSSSKLHVFRLYKNQARDKAN